MDKTCTKHVSMYWFIISCAPETWQGTCEHWLSSVYVNVHLDKPAMIWYKEIIFQINLKRFQIALYICVSTCTDSMDQFHVTSLQETWSYLFTHYLTSTQSKTGRQMIRYSFHMLLAQWFTLSIHSYIGYPVETSGMQQMLISYDKHGLKPLLLMCDQLSYNL